MDDEMIQAIVDELRFLLAKMDKRDIDALEFGFVNDTCPSMLFSIFIHCMENYHIFNDKQMENLSEFIKQMSNGE